MNNPTAQFFQFDLLNLAHKGIWPIDPKRKGQLKVGMKLLILSQHCDTGPEMAAHTVDINDLLADREGAKRMAQLCGDLFDETPPDATDIEQARFANITDSELFNDLDNSLGNDL